MLLRALGTVGLALVPQATLAAEWSGTISCGTLLNATSQTSHERSFTNKVTLAIVDGHAVLLREFSGGSERIEGEAPGTGPLQLEGYGSDLDRPNDLWHTRVTLAPRGSGYEGTAVIESDDGAKRYRDCTMALTRRDPDSAATSDPAPSPQARPAATRVAPTPPAAKATNPDHAFGSAGTCWQPQNMIGCFTNMDKVFPMREIRNGAPVLALPVNRKPVTYRYNNADYTAADFLDHHRTLGLLIIKDGQIVEEQYRHGTGPTTRFYSASMAKTLLGMLVGIALDREILKSIDDPAERYVPELAGSAYGKATIAQLLRMSSGVRMTPHVGAGDSDEVRLFRVMMGLREGSVMDFLRNVPEGEFKPGARFRYMSSDSIVLGYMLTRASGRTLSDLASDWIWQHIGAQQNAQWQLMKDGVEYGGGNIFATLRDYGRLGILMANDGKVDGRSLVPARWIEDGTDPNAQPWAFKPGASGGWFGYGYQTWIFPLRTRTIAMRGAYGQGIFVQPRSRIVMVVVSALPTVTDREEGDERHALWYGVLRSLDGYMY